MEEFYFEGMSVQRYQPYPDRPTVIFLHDSLGCVELWRDFPMKLSELASVNICVYDRIGYGKSQPMSSYHRENDYMEKEAEILLVLIDHLSIKNVILFGHSDGGTIALYAASKNHDVITSVVVEAAHIYVEDVTIKGIHDALHQYEFSDFSTRLAKYHGDKVDMLIQAWTTIWNSEEFRQWNMISHLHHITCPVLFIQGEKDEYGTIAQLVDTLQNIQGEGRSFIIPNVGHTPHKEIPEIVRDKVVEFIHDVENMSGH